MKQWTGVILAAGDGKRLAGSGIAAPKPLAPVTATKTLLDLSYDSLDESGVESVYCITNSRYIGSIRSHIATGRFAKIKLLERNTRSAFYTLLTLEEFQDTHKNFIVLNVDSTITSKYILQAIDISADTSDSTMVYGFTDFNCADQSPLFVDVDSETQRVLALGDKVQKKQFVTSGRYIFTSVVFSLFREARQRSIVTLREFLRFTSCRSAVLGIYVPNSVDVDTAVDLRRAQKIYESDGV
jgi:NDP-sugar pyrophosphorylase family protein